MASNRPAPEFSYAPIDEEFGEADERTWEEWNPTEESVRPVRGRHRVAKQRGGLARSSTVLGVGVIAAVGAGGIATAQGGKPPVHISMPDLSAVKDSLPDAKSLPGVGALISDVSGDDDESGTSATPLTGAGISTADARQGTTAGEALRARIMQQAEQQQDQAVDAEAAAAEEAAAKKAAEDAAKEQGAAEAKAAADKKAAEEAAKKKAEAERLAKLAKSFTLPVASYTITGTFGQPGSMWSSGYHTGLDFAAPTGTPLKAIHSGTVKEGRLGGRVRLPHRPGAAGRHRALVLPPVVPQRQRGPEGDQRRRHRPRRRHRQRDRAAPPPGGPPRRPGDRGRPRAVAALQRPDDLRLATLRTPAVLTATPDVRAAGPACPEYLDPFRCCDRP